MLIFTRIGTVTREKRRNIKHFIFCNGNSRYFFLFKYLNEIFNTHVENPKRNILTKSHVNRITWSDVTAINKPLHRYFFILFIFIIILLSGLPNKHLNLFKYLNDIWRASSTP